MAWAPRVAVVDSGGNRCREYRVELTLSAEICHVFPMNGGQYDWTCELAFVATSCSNYSDLTPQTASRRHT